MMSKALNFKQQPTPGMQYSPFAALPVFQAPPPSAQAGLYHLHQLPEVFQYSLNQQLLCPSSSSAQQHPRAHSRDAHLLMNGMNPYPHYPATVSLTQYSGGKDTNFGVQHSTYSLKHQSPPIKRKKPIQGNGVAVISQSTTKKAVGSCIRNKVREGSPDAVSPFQVGAGGNFTHRQSMDQAIVLNNKRGGTNIQKKSVREISGKSVQKRVAVQHNNFIVPSTGNSKQPQTRQVGAHHSSSMSHSKNSYQTTQSVFATFSNAKTRLSQPPLGSKLPTSSAMLQSPQPKSKQQQRSPLVPTAARQALNFQASPVLNYKYSREQQDQHGSPSNHQVSGQKDSIPSSMITKVPGQQKQMARQSTSTNLKSNSKKLKENIHRQLLPGTGSFDMNFKRPSATGKNQSPPLPHYQRNMKSQSKNGVVKKVINSVPKKPSKSKLVPALQTNHTVAKHSQQKVIVSKLSPQATRINMQQALYRVSEEKQPLSLSGNSFDDSPRVLRLPSSAGSQHLPAHPAFNQQQIDPSQYNFDPALDNNGVLTVSLPQNILSHHNSPIPLNKKLSTEKSPVTNSSNKISAAALEYLLQSSQRQNNQVITSILRGLSQSSENKHQQQNVAQGSPLVAHSAKSNEFAAKSRSGKKCRSSPAKAMEQLRVTQPQQKKEEQITSPSPTVNPFLQVTPVDKLLSQGVLMTPAIREKEVSKLNPRVLQDKENFMVLSNDANSYQKHHHPSLIIGKQSSFVNQLPPDENMMLMKSQTKKQPPLGFGLRNTNQQQDNHHLYHQMTVQQNSIMMMDTTPLRKHVSHHYNKDEEELERPLKELVEMRRQELIIGGGSKNVEDLINQNKQGKSGSSGSQNSYARPFVVKEFNLNGLGSQQAALSLTNSSPLCSSSQSSASVKHSAMRDDLKKQLIEGILSAQTQQHLYSSSQRDINKKALPTQNTEVVVQSNKRKNSEQVSSSQLSSCSEVSKATIVRERKVGVPPLNFDKIVFSSERNHHAHHNNVQILHSQKQQHNKAVFINVGEKLKQSESSMIETENSEEFRGRNLFYGNGMIRHHQPLNNSFASQGDLQKQVEAKLHKMQFERVFIEPSHKRDDLCAYFIKKYQIAQGLIPDPKKVREERRLLGLQSENSSDNSTDDALSEMSNFSMEIEMLNRLHIEKNNRCKLGELPVMMVDSLQDGALLYREIIDRETGKITFKVDERPQIQFHAPITQSKSTRPQTAAIPKFEGSLTGQLRGMLLPQHAADSARDIGMHLVGDGGEVLNMAGNRYFESSHSSENNDGSYRPNKKRHAHQKYSDYSSSPANHSDDEEDCEFEREFKKVPRRRIEEEFNEERNHHAIQLQDIRVQGFNSIEEQQQMMYDQEHQRLLEQQLMLMRQLSEIQQQHDQYLMPAIIKQTSVPLPVMHSKHQSIGMGYSHDANANNDFEGIQELSGQNSYSCEQIMEQLYQQRSNNSNPFSLAKPTEENQMIYLQQRLPMTNQHHDELEQSYDQAVKEFKWLQENSEPPAMMRKFELTGKSLSIPKQESDASPVTPADIRNAPCKKAPQQHHGGWSTSSYNSDLQRQNQESRPNKHVRRLLDSQSSSLSKNDDDQVVENLFQNPMVKNNLNYSRQQQNFNQDSSSQSSQISEQILEEPFTFENDHEKLCFMQELREELGIRTKEEQNQRILPGIKTVMEGFLGYQPSYYKQIPFIFRDQQMSIALEVFNFDNNNNINGSIQVRPQSSPAEFIQTNINLEKQKQYQL